MRSGMAGEVRRRWSSPAVRREKVELDGGDRVGKVLLARECGGGGLGSVEPSGCSRTAVVFLTRDALSTARGH